jgi:DNA polymerase-3 subunit delta
MALAQSFDTCFRALRAGNLSAAYYLTGDEEVLKDELVALLVEQSLADASTRDFNLDVRGAGDVDGERLHALVETPPMLANRRVVVIRNLEQWRKNAAVWDVLHTYLQHPSPTTVLVLWHGPGQAPVAKLASATTHVAVEPLPQARVTKWVQRRAAQVGVAFSAAAVEHLLSTVGVGLAELGMEIDKLAAAVPAGRTVGPDDVARFVGVRRGETPTDWVGSVLHREAIRAIEMLPVVLAAPGTSGVRLVSALGTALVGVQLARANLDGGMPSGRVEQVVYEAIKRARLRGLGEWRAEAAMWTKAAAGWTRSELVHAIASTSAADRALKSTTISDEIGTLTDLLLAAAPRTAAA